MPTGVSVRGHISVGETKAEARSWINKRSSTTFFVPFVFVSPSRSSHLRERDARNNFSQPGKRDSSWSFIFFFFFFLCENKSKEKGGSWELQATLNVERRRGRRRTRRRRRRRRSIEREWARGGVGGKGGRREDKKEVPVVVEEAKKERWRCYRGFSRSISGPASNRYVRPLRSFYLSLHSLTLSLSKELTLLFSST